MDNLNNGQNQYSPDIMSFQNSQNNQYNQFDQINQYNQYDQQNTYTGDNGNYDGVSSALTEDNLDSNFANKPAKTKSGSKKFVLLGIIAFLAVIVGIAVYYFISIFTESFEVNDLDKVNEACDEVFDKTIEVKDYAGPFVVGGVEYAVKRQGIIRGDIDNVVWSVYWTEFDDESNAKKFLAQYEESIDERHDKLKDTIGDSSRISNSHKVEWSYEYKDDEDRGAKILIARTDNCIVEFIMYGDNDKIDTLYKKFKRRIK